MEGLRNLSAMQVLEQFENFSFVSVVGRIVISLRFRFVSFRRGIRIDDYSTSD